MSVLRTAALRARAPAPMLAPARFASSDATASASASTSASASANAECTSPTGLPMAWSEYFQMRRRRKNWANITSVPTSIGGLLAGASYFANLQLGPETTTIMGIDPMFVYGGSTLACMLGGWLVGPTIGNALFSVTHPKLARGNPPPLEVMDREFYHRIKEKRADPSRQSVTNPAPDFYGEKIVSIPTYRRWLKDQKAYERKAAHGVDGDEE